MLPVVGTKTKSASSSSPDSADAHAPRTFDIDPLAQLLRTLRIIGKQPPRSLILPGLYVLVYFLFADVGLPAFLGRFSSAHDYVGPFDPKLQPNRVVDGLFVPILAYYYGQVSLLFPELFDRLRQNGVFGPRQVEDSENQVGDSKNLRYHRQLYDRWAGSIWLFPVAITATFVIGLRGSLDYFSPPHTHSFINSDPYVFAFNQAMWMLNFYLVAAIAMRYVLFTGWLLLLQRKEAIERLAPEVLHADDRMGFSPITECIVTAAKIFTVALLILVFVIRGNENIGLAATSPNWLGYLALLIISLPFVVLPIYLVHRIMLRQKENYIRRVEDEESYPHSSWILDDRASTEPRDRERWRDAQLVFLRLSQVKDWPVTLEEAATVFFTYLLGTVFTILSTLQSIIQFLR